MNNMRRNRTRYIYAGAVRALAGCLLIGLVLSACLPQTPQPPHVPQLPQAPQVLNLPQSPQPPHVPAPARAGRVARKEIEASGAVEPAPAKLTGTADSTGSTPADTPGAAPTDTVTPVNTADAATPMPQWQAPQPAPTPTPTQTLALAPIQARPMGHAETDTAAGALRPPGRQQATVSGSNRLPDPEPVRAPATARTERAAESLPQAPIHGLPAGLPAGPADVALPAVALPTASAAPAAVPYGGAAAPIAEARMTAGPGSEAFASELGSHLTTFVRDGVQHARLHLHPAELGPVTVQIQIDGQAAQVHMAAESGLTRQALEQSMPLLAGSLREAGLTLSGGGVFEQPRQQRDPAPQGTPSGSRPGPERADEPALRPGLTAMRRRGVVDLVA